MQKEKLVEVIAERNEQAEQYATRQASELIQAIISEQRNITRSTKHIGELREQLAKLEVDVVDPTAVLGEDGE